MRLETRGPEVGPCNICGTTAKLTEDHIPPKGFPRVTQAVLVDVHRWLGTTQTGRRDRRFQRGVTYRSICHQCNSDLLGARYDPALIALAKDIDRVIGERLWLPISVEVPLNRVMRSAVGHLLAHGLDLHRRGTFFSEMSDYFLDTTQKLPTSYTAHMWLYPHNDQFVSQCIGLVYPGRSQQTITASILKFYPLCIGLFKDSQPELGWMETLRVDDSLCSDINATRRVDIPTSGLPPKLWPEAPREDENEAVMHTSLSLGAFRP